MALKNLGAYLFIQREIPREWTLLTGDQPDSEDINTTFPRFDFYFDDFAYL